MQEKHKKTTGTQWIKWLIAIVLVVGPAWWMTNTALQQNAITCEVCVQFNGQTNCAKAAGETQTTCQRTAVDTACGTLASGVQQSIQCTQKRPLSIDFL